MADFRAFLAPPDPIVLPYFGGTRVEAAERRYRVDADLEPGWWRFRVDGRWVVPVSPAAPTDLGALPRVHGHWIDGWIVVDGKQLVRIALRPDDEPPALARVTGRRWYSGDTLFDALDLEDEAELEARRRFDAREPLTALRAVAPSLRVAFGVGLGAAVARQLGVEVSVRELAPHAVAIAVGGDAAARGCLQELAVARSEADRAARERAEHRRTAATARDARPITRHADPARRADEALEGARARMLSCRRIERGTVLDVTYEVDGVRIVSMVDADSLQIIDPGICLSGEHDVLTLDAMPSVIREAISDEHLNITRHA